MEHVMDLETCLTQNTGVVWMVRWGVVEHLLEEESIARYPLDGCDKE